MVFRKLKRKLGLGSALADHPLATNRGGFDLRHAAGFSAALDSADYLISEMPTAQYFGGAGDLLSFAVGEAREGQFLEFGVASGATINHIADRHPNGTIVGFDSFEGLPETWRSGFHKGMFAVARMPTVRNNVRLIKGLFADTLPGYLASTSEPVSFVHVDCDLYSSTKTVFDLVGPRMAERCVLVFDEYFNYPGWRMHEHRAFREFLANTGRTARYVAAVPKHQQVCAILDL
jgi:predicted O-methyltransferase YrrM